MSRRTSAGLQAAVLLSGALAGCSVDLQPPDGASITCASDADCPSGWFCKVAIQTCSRSHEVGLSPTLASAAVITPLVASAGAVVTVTFRTSVTLFSDPVVELVMPASARIGFLKQSVDGQNYTYSLVISPTAAEGIRQVVATLVGRDGAEAKDVALGSVTVDRTPPAITRIDVEPPVARAGQEVAVAVTIGEVLAVAPTAQLGGVNLASPTTDPTGRVWTFRSTVSGSETPGAIPVRAQAVDAAGNFAEGSAAVILDFTPPALAGPAEIPVAAVREGQAAVVRLAFSEPLSGDPVAVLVPAGGGASLPLTVAERVGTTYTFFRTVGAADAEGPWQARLVSASDLGGNTLSGVTLGALTIDRTSPTAITGPTVGPVVGTAPYTWRAGVTPTVSFSVSEPLATAPTVRLLTLAAPAFLCSSPAAQSYTCTLSRALDATVDLPQGTTPISISFTDLAGNPGTASASGVVDYAAPTLLTAAPTAARFPSGGAIGYQVSASEPLGASPTLTVRKGGVAQADFFGAPASSSSTSAVWTRPVAGGLDGSYTVDVVLQDVAGNVALTAPGVGFAVDTVSPQIATGPTLGPVVGLAPYAWRVGVVPTVSFTVTEDLITAPTVRLLSGAQPAFTCSSPAPRSYACTLSRSLDAALDLPQGTTPVSISYTDLAGNPGFASAAAVLDYTAPALIAGSTSLLLTPPPGALVTTVTSATAGTRVRCSFSVNEPLSADPVVSTASPEALTFTKVIQAGTSYTYDLVVPAGSHEPGTYAVQARLTDVAGNVATVAVPLPGAGLVIDTTAPASPDTVTASRIVYARAPWGTSAAAAAPSFTITGAAGAVERGATFIAYDGPNPALAREIGRAVAASDGSFTAMSLVAADRQRVYLLQVDAAGNASDADGAVAGPQATLVHDVTWTATLNGKVPGSTQENPSTLEARQRFHGALEEPASVSSTLPASSRGSLAWTLGAAQAWPATVGPAAFDARRGRLVLPLVGSVSEWDGKTWTTVTTTGGPSEIGSVVFDARHGEILVYTNSCAGGTVLWAWDGGTWWPRADGVSYTQWGAAPGGPLPGPHRNSLMVYDEARGEVLLSQGQWGGPYICGDVGGNVDRGVYAWDGSSWIARPGSFGALTAYAHMAYDASRSVIVRMDGNGLQEWNGTAWTAITVTDPEGDGNPSNAIGEFVYDPSLGRVIFRADGYTWSWTGNSWRRYGVSQAGSMATDTVARTVWVVSTTALWRGSGGSWSQAVAPAAAITSVAAAYNASYATMEVFGSAGQVYRWSAGAWTEVTPTDPEADGNPASLQTAAREPLSNTTFAYEAGVGLWRWNGVSWARVTPSGGVTPSYGSFASYPGYGLVNVTNGTGATISLWTGSQWAAWGASYSVGYRTCGPPSYSAALGSLVVPSKSNPYGPDCILNLFAAGTWSSSGVLTGWGAINVLADDARGRTFGVHNATTTYQLAASPYVSVAQVDDPGGTGYPVSVTASAWDPSRPATLLLSGGSTWYLEPEAASTPAHLFRAAYASAGGPPASSCLAGTCSISSVRLGWTGVATSAENVAATQALLSIWDGTRFYPVTTVSAAVGATATVSLDITNPILIGRMGNTAGELVTALKINASPLSTPLLRTDDVSVTVTYRLP